MEFTIFFKILLRRKYIFIPLFLLILMIPLLLSAWKKPVYKKSSIIIFNKVDLQTVFLEKLPKALGEISFFDVDDTQDNLSTFLKNETIIQNVISDLDYAYDTEDFLTSLPFLKFLFSSQTKAMSIDKESGNEVFEISGYASSTKEAAHISRQFVKTAARFMGELNKSTCLKIKSILSEYNQEIHEKLRSVQNKMHLFSQQHDYVDLETQLDSLYQEISQNRNLELKHRRFLNKVESEQKALKQQLKDIPEFHTIRQTMAKNPVLENAQKKLVELKWSLAEKKVELTSNHADVISHIKVIDEVKETIKNETEKIFSSETWERNDYNTSLMNKYNENIINKIIAKLDIQIIQKVIKDAERKAIKLKESDTSYQLLLDQALLNKNIIKQNQNLLNALLVVEKMDFNNLKIIHLADTKEDSSVIFFPNYKFVLSFSVFLAFWGAFVFALFVDYIDPNIKDIEAAEAILDKMILTDISNIKQKGIAGYIRFFFPLTSNACNRSVRYILSWLKKEKKEEPVHFVGVASTKFGEGVTQTAYIVAKSLAELGEKVLLIEANGITPCLGKLLKQSPEYGMSDLFQKQSSFSDSIVQIDSDLSAIFFSGQQNSSFYMKVNFISTIQSFLSESDKYEWIIVDLPALEADAATVNILDHCDSVLFNIGLMKVKKREIKKSMGQLKTKKNLFDRTCFITNRHRSFLPLFLT